MIKFLKILYNKINEFIEYNKVKNNNKFISIINKINNFIIQINLGEEFLELNN